MNASPSSFIAARLTEQTESASAIPLRAAALEAARVEAGGCCESRSCARRLRRSRRVRFVVWFIALNLPLLAILGLVRPRAGNTEHVYGVQMHLHGSMSEGPGSMRGHNVIARRLNGAVDVLWWTDHDWRIAAHTYLEEFDFEDSLVAWNTVPTAGGARQVRAEWKQLAETPAPRSVSARFSTDAPRLGKGSFSVAVVANGGDWQRVAYRLETEQKRHIASLASDVRLHLALRPRQFGPNARLVVRVLLSQQPPDYRGRIDYVFTGSGGLVASTRMLDETSEGFPIKVAAITKPLETGRWNDVVMNVSQDAEKYGLGGVDNSMAEIVVSVEARNGARCEIGLDAFRIERETIGDPLFQREKAMARTLDGKTVNHVGLEISYAAHMNVYGASMPLPDFSAHPGGFDHRAAVKFAHEHGGIVALAHMFGPGGRGGIRDRFKPPFRARFQRIRRAVRGERGYGADMIEIGYRERFFGIDAFVEVWDELSAEGVYITGTGVSDSHSNTKGWLTGPNNFITWVYAASSSQEDLAAGLVAGRAFFGDPTRFDGRMDITTHEGFHMGQVVATDKPAHVVRFFVDGVRPGQRVRLIRNGAALGDFKADGRKFERSESIAIQGRTFVRIELYDGDGPFALSNPLYFTTATPAGGIPVPRRTIGK